MKKERVCQLLNEALAGRTVTSAAIESVTSEVHGDVYIVHFVLDAVLKVGLTSALLRRQNVESLAIEQGLQETFVGRRVNGVSITAGDDGAAEVALSLTGVDSSILFRSVESLHCGPESEINEALLSAGLQVPYHVMTDGEDEEVEEDEKDEEVDLAELLDNLTNPNHELFNINFATGIMGIRPDWFSDEERERVAAWLREQE